MTSTPRHITAGMPQIFIDLNDVEELDNIEQLFHSAEKHSANPVIYPKKPWERRGGGPAASVIYDAEEKVFKCWYQGIINDTWGNEVYSTPQRRQAVLNYAVSANGAHWERPNLGLYEVLNTKDNNVVVPPEYHDGQDHWESVLKDPFDPDPQRRFKAIGWSSYDPDDSGWCQSYGSCGIYTMTSPDGQRWMHTKEPVFHFRPRPGSKDLGPVGDAQSMMIDTKQKRYVAFLRSSNRLFSVSNDFVKWTPPEISLSPLPNQPGDSTLYNHVGFNYGDQYLGFVSYFHTLEDDPRHPQMDLRLLSSHDGLHFNFPGPKPRDRNPVVGCGAIGDWDRFITSQTGAPPIRVGDKLYIYYRGFVRRHKPFGLPHNKDTYEGGGIGLATIRADGFASLGAGFDSGRITTKPFTFNGSKLLINAKANFFADVQGEVIDEQGKSVRGYTLEDSVAMTEDKIDYIVTWKNKKDLSELVGRPIKLRFHLTNAQLYSYQIG